MKSIEATIMHILIDLTNHNQTLKEAYECLLEEFERRLENGKNN